MEDISESARAVEVGKCAESFVYFCETYVKISHPNKGLIPFTLYDYQKRYIDFISNNRFVLGVKFRQGGFSTLNVVWALWRCLFKFDEHIMFLSKSDREAIAAGEIAKLAIEELPDWLKPKMEKNNQHQKLFQDTGCKLFFYTPEAARGKKINYMFLDEAAFIANMEKHWKAFWPCLSTGENCIAVSTVNGTKNWFYDTYQDAKNDKNNFKIFECNYQEHPDYDNLDWIRNTRSQLGHKGWLQEVMCDFLAEDDSIVISDNDQPITLVGDKLVKDKLVWEDPIVLNNSKNMVVKKEFKHLEDLLEQQVQNSLIKEYEKKGSKFPKNSVEERRILRDLEKRFLEDPKNADLIAKKNSIKDNNVESHLIGENNGETCKLRLQRADMCTHVADYWYSDEATSIADEQLGLYEDSTLWDHLKQKDFNLEQLDKRVTDDILALSGLIDTDDINEDYKHCDEKTPVVKILEGIKKSGLFPNELKVAFNNKQFCVNNAPTNIKEFDVMCLYNGLASFTSPAKATEKVIDVICKRMKPLFELKLQEEPTNDKKVLKKKLSYSE